MCCLYQLTHYGEEEAALGVSYAPQSQYQYLCDHAEVAKKLN